jgi:hypothetical protein
MNAKAGAVTDGYLLQRIWGSESLLDILCDPAAFDLGTARSLAGQLARRYPDVDLRLALELMKVSAGDSHVERCLDVLEAIPSAGRRLVIPLVSLMKSSNAAVRARAAKFLGKRVDNLNWARTHFNDSDPRVRANVVESLWGTDSSEVQALLWKAAEDGHNRVCGNALLPLYRLGAVEVLPLIRDLAGHERPDFRATAAWVMGNTGDFRFSETLKGLRGDPDTRVRASVLRALVQLKKAETQWSEIGIPHELQFCEDLEGIRRFAFDVANSSFRPLLPTDVAITTNGAPVWQYTLRRPYSSPIKAVFLIPACHPTEAGPSLIEALLACEAAKGPQDEWSVVRFKEQGVDDQSGRLSELRGTGNYVTPIVPSPYKGPSLRSAISKFEELPLVRTDDLEAIIRVFGPRGPNRHLVLMVWPSTLKGPTVATLARRTRERGIVVNVISQQGSGDEPLQALARQTDGAFTSVPPGGISPDRLITFYSSLSHRYEVTYPVSNAGSSFELRIRLQLMGEENLQLMNISAEARACRP